LASWREITDCGTTRRSTFAGAAAASGSATMGSSAACNPVACRSSRSTAVLPSGGAASSASNASSEPSRAAVLASTVAMALIGFKRALRRASLRSSALTRSRSSRTSSATA
jgi:hypothetical protein